MRITGSGPDGGITAILYRGSKDQVQNAGADNEFSYRPVFAGAGVFGNYLFFDKLDLLGGYIHGLDDWKVEQTDSVKNHTQNTYRGEADYYPKTGTALMARLDRGTATIPTQPTLHTRTWGVGVEHSLTEMGNVLVRGS